MWYAAGNTSSYEMCARKGLGVLGFSVQSLDDLGPVVAAYKKGIAQAEPIGAFVNDNVLVSIGASVHEDAGRGGAAGLQPRSRLLVERRCSATTTPFPHPAGLPRWPERLPPMPPEYIPAARQSGLIIGDPEHALAQARRWEAAGVDQLVVSTGVAPHAEVLETIRLFGEHVIPKLDTDPVHRTTRMREGAH